MKKPKRQEPVVKVRTRAAVLEAEARAGDARRRRILREVNAERRKQALKYGGDLHDDGHGIKDFAWMIQQEARYMERWDSERDGREKAVRVAALAFAAIEKIDRKSSKVKD